MSFTVKEVEEKIDSFVESQSTEEGEYEYEGYSNFYEWLKDSGYYSDKDKQGVEVPELGFVKHVEDFGGEGSGDEYWVVFSVGDQFFKKDGWYASYDGGELDGDLHEVVPVQVSRTEYEIKK